MLLCHEEAATWGSDLDDRAFWGSVRRENAMTIDRLLRAIAGREAFGKGDEKFGGQESSPLSLSADAGKDLIGPEKGETLKANIWKWPRPQPESMS